MTLAATSPNITARERNGRGIFTSVLLQALSGEAVDKDGHVTVSELFQYLQRHMVNEQVPGQYGFDRSRYPFTLAYYPDLSEEAQNYQGEVERKNHRDTEIREMAKIFLDEIITDPNFFVSRAGHSKAFDELVCQDAFLTDLDIEIVKDFFSRERVSQQDDYRTGAASEELLKNFRFVQEESLVYGALLCLGMKPQKWLSSAITHCIVWPGKEQDNLEDRKEYGDNLITQYNLIIDFLRKNLRLARIRAREEQNEQWEIPFVALREVVANALIHREYANRQDGVYVEIFSDRVEITNPGQLPEGTSPEVFIAGGGSLPKNPVIARIFYLCGYVEIVGSGMRHIQQALAKAALPPPEFKEDKATKKFKVILYRPPSIQVGNMTQIGDQTVSLSQLRPKPIGIPENIPLRGSSSFVGRQDDLELLHRELNRTDRVSISAIAGMGGVGKTELVIQYTRQHLQDYPGGVCWLQARTGDLLAQVIEYARNTLMLDVPQERHTQPLTLAQQLQWCWEYWEPVGRVLLVLDDVADLTSCQPILLAPPDRFRILLTTRHRALDTGFFELSLDVLSPDASLRLIEDLVGQDRVSRERDTAEALCQWLGYLPLGLELVGRYLAQDRGLSFAEMREQLQEAERPLEDASLEGDYSLMTAHRSVRAAFELSWQELDSDAKDVAQLLSLFAPVAVPWELATRGMQQVKGMTYRIRSARRQLDNLNLLQPVKGLAEVVRLHPLIREFLQEKSAAESLMAQEDLKRALAQIMVEIAQHIPQTPTLETIQTLVPLMPHLAEVAEQFIDFLADDELLWPFVGLGRFYQGQGLYTLAEPWYEVCLKNTQDRLGEEHPSVAASLNNLAALYRSQGRYSEAEPLYRDALEMSRRLLGEEHSFVATSLNNLAGLYESQGRYSEAEPLYHDALEMSRRLLGEEHPDVAASLNNLAALYRSQGRYSEAEPLYRDALEMSRRLLGEEHPSVAASLNNLAGLYSSQGRYSEAEPLYRDALEIRKRLLGLEHPSVATSLNNLAALYESQGRYSEAEPLYRDALEMSKRLLGEEHPSVATSLNNLAELYRSQGRYSEAEPLYRDALEMSRRLLGEDHPSVATSLNNLAALYANQGQFEKAAPLLEQAVWMFRQLLGDEHPSTQTLKQNLELVKAEMR